MDDIDQRFLVTSMYICPFEITDDRFVVQKEGYPTRLCVIDNEQNIAIDICHGLKYDYVKIMSGLHFVSNYSDKIKSQKRLAVFPQQLV